MAEDPAKTYKNPVVNYSLPDPSVIRAEDVRGIKRNCKLIP